MTAAQQKRITRDLSEIAREPVEVEKISGTLYAFSSELACLRIFTKYNLIHSPRARVGYSVNLERHFFSIELAGG
jgi:hypothetical protein